MQARRTKRKRARGGLAMRLVAPLRSRATLVSGGFLLLGTAIVANALFMQAGRHPAPLFVTRPGPEEAIAREAPQPDLLVQAVQAELQEIGLYHGPVDGIAGPRTQAAILAFEHRSGRETTGRATAEILAAVQAAGEAERDVAADPLAQPVVEHAAPANAQVAAVQAALARAAYGPVTADGVFGPETRDAINRFQRAYGLPETGTIDDALIVQLRAAGAFDDG